MTKKNKNIISIIVLVIMIVCMFFTLKTMKEYDNMTSLKYKFVPITTNKKETLDNKDSEKNNTEESTEETEKNETTKKDKKVKKNRPSTRFKKRQNYYESKTFNKNIKESKSKDLLIILYGLESAVMGATITFIIFTNMKTKKK